ncbi:phosphoribosyl-ATP pyrophosphohydrolase [Candidatus Saccharibacteria bacterium]|nr:MAG: phosphoribosyl-ATP pyrophosphohydrolase [Candidatus Saccharibacteria bacterium]
MKHTHTETDLPIENQYPKLVRDNIPVMIERDGKTATTHIAGEEEYVSFLLAKLVEEATELKNAVDSDHRQEEIADVREVLGAIQAALGFSEDELREVQASKLAERGGFAGRIILDLKPE